jgi:hypothetical protein
MVDTPSERVAVVVWALMHGQRLTTRQVATLSGLSVQGAFGLMCRISRVLPLYQDEQNVWQFCTEIEEASTGRID